MSMLGLASTGADAARKGGSSLSVPDASFGDTVVATVSPVPDVRTWVYAQCFQDGDRVYAEIPELDAGGTAVLNLGPTMAWDGGAADCVAEALVYKGNNRFRTIARTTFGVTAG